MIGKYCIVRGNNSGVFAGTVKEIEGPRVLMENVRQIWYWDGASSISQLAKFGTAAPQNCKFTVRVDSVLLLDVIEIIPCTEKAVQSIEKVKEWKQKQ